MPRRSVNDGARVLRAGELLHRLHVVEEGDRHELHLVAGDAAQQIGTAVASNSMDSGKHLGAHHLLVRVRVARLGPSMPDSANHRCSRAVRSSPTDLPRLHRSKERRFHDLARPCRGLTTRVPASELESSGNSGIAVGSAWGAPGEMISPRLHANWTLRLGIGDSG